MVTGPRGPSGAEVDLWGQLEEKGVGTGKQKRGDGCTGKTSQAEGPSEPDPCPWPGQC